MTSEILQHKESDSLCFAHRAIIDALAPKLEKWYSASQLYDYFSQHCHDSTSRIIIEMFTPTIEKILKRNTDFSMHPQTKMLVQKYLLVLASQNDDFHTIEDFIHRMHGPMIICPFLLVPSNLIAVCLGGINKLFGDRKKHEENSSLTEETTKIELVSYLKILETMSTFDDWRRHVGLVLQPIPFSCEALKHDCFSKISKSILQNLVEDTRCDIHRTVLSVREDKDGWLEMFSLHGILCNDDGNMFSLMLSKLISCCCRKKSFLLNINKLLSSSLISLALKEDRSSLNTLCAMLELDAVKNYHYKEKIISTLTSTQTGLIMYDKVCEREKALRILQQKCGPTEFTLPSHSTDKNLASLLSEGSFGNLQSLNLAFTNVTSACAEHLIKLPALRNLNLWSTRFGDDGLEMISEHLTQLEELNLCETLVTDKGLSYLENLKGMRKLNLSSTNVSFLAILTLKKQLPHLEECDVRYTNDY